MNESGKRYFRFEDLDDMCEGRKIARDEIAERLGIRKGETLHSIGNLFNRFNDIEKQIEFLVGVSKFAKDQGFDNIRMDIDEGYCWIRGSRDETKEEIELRKKQEDLESLKQAEVEMTYHKVRYEELKAKVDSRSK